MFWRQKVPGMRGQLSAELSTWSHRERVSWVTLSWSLCGLEPQLGRGVFWKETWVWLEEKVRSPKSTGLSWGWGLDLGHSWIGKDTFLSRRVFWESCVGAYLLLCRQQRASLIRERGGVEVGGYSLKLTGRLRVRQAKNLTVKGSL